MTLAEWLASVELWAIGVLFDIELAMAAREMVGPRRVGGNPPL